MLAMWPSATALAVLAGSVLGATNRDLATLAARNLQLAALKAKTQLSPRQSNTPLLEPHFPPVCWEDCEFFSGATEYACWYSTVECDRLCNDNQRNSRRWCVNCMSKSENNATQKEVNDVIAWEAKFENYCNPPEPKPVDPSTGEPKPADPSTGEPKDADPTTGEPKPVDPPTRNPGTERPCSQCDDLNPRVMIACNSSNPATCSGLCSDLSLMHECVDCYNKAAPGSFDEFESYVRDADWYCQTDGGKGCTGMMADSISLCSGDNDKCKGICEGEAWERVQTCNREVPGSGLTGGQVGKITSGTTTLIKFCEKPEPKCENECKAILDTQYDLCKDSDVAKCRGMCSDNNLPALERCSNCTNVEGALSLYDPATVGHLGSDYTKWCNTKEDDPEVAKPPAVTKPEEVTRQDDAEITNPFTDKPTSNKSSSSSDSSSFPTWGIGAAVGGGVAVLAVASAIVAYNYQCECDHDHRRLKRRRRKNKKQSGDDTPPQKPQQQMHQTGPLQEHPQLVGYIMPGEAQPQQAGYFGGGAAGASAADAATPVSPPVSFAHTPLSPPGSPPPVDPRMSYPYPQGYPQQGYPQQGYAQPGYPQQGYPQQGYQ